MGLVLQAHQKLMIGFNEYPNIMIKMLNMCIKDSASCVMFADPVCARVWSEHACVHVCVCACAHARGCMHA